MSLNEFRTKICQISFEHLGNFTYVDNSLLYPSVYNMRFYFYSFYQYYCIYVFIHLFIIY